MRWRTGYDGSLGGCTSGGRAPRSHPPREPRGRGPHRADTEPRSLWSARRRPWPRRWIFSRRGTPIWPSSTWITTRVPTCSSAWAPSNSLAASGTPVLGLTRRGDLPNKLKAFDLGVDDILAMPFSPEELLWSIVITRRASGVDRPIVPRSDSARWRSTSSTVWSVRASVIHLSAIDQSLLYLLASRGGRVISRDEILDGVWGTDFVAEQHRRSPYPEPADQAAERLPPPALHRHRPGQGLSVHPDILEPGLGRWVRRGRGSARLTR